MKKTYWKYCPIKTKRAHNLRKLSLFKPITDLCVPKPHIVFNSTIARNFGDINSLKYCYWRVHSLASIPPLAVSVSPVTYEASSDARNAATPAISSGSPNLKINQHNNNNNNNEKSSMVFGLFVEGHSCHIRIMAHRRDVIRPRHISLDASLSYITCENLVLMIPGAMQLTRTLCTDSSLLSALVRPSNAVLLTEYAPSI